MSLNLLEYLQNKPPNYPMVLVSFFVTNPSTLRKMKEKWKHRDVGNSKYKDGYKPKQNQIDDKELGGEIALIDPKNLQQGFLTTMDVSAAFGMYFDSLENSLYCTGGKFVFKIQKGRITDTFSHPLFNDIHGLEGEDNQHIYVVSTGTDSILKFEKNNWESPVWEWLATEHGYNKSPSGDIRHIDKNIRYNELVTETPMHTTHVNSCISNDTSVFATLFHQGTIVEIDKNTLETTTILSGLTSPHSIRKINSGYSVCDSRANRVFLLDKRFEIVNEIYPNIAWVQDALPINQNEFLIADSNNERLITTNLSGDTLQLLDYSDKKIASFCQIEAKDVCEIFES